MTASAYVLQLILSGYLLRFPGIRIINSHLGGATPMCRRARMITSRSTPDTPEYPNVAAKRVWYDMVSHLHVPALERFDDDIAARPMRADADRAVTLVRISTA